MTAPLLAFESVSKRFGGTQAVDQVSFDVHAGEIVALLGENGAGKSTLIKLLAGIHPLDSGRILLEGQPEQHWRTASRSRQPIAFIHQDLGLVEWMTVAENMALGMGYPRRFGLIDWKAARTAARRVMQRVGCDLDPERRVFSLTRAEKSLLAIARALEVEARLLVLDEPSASLPMADVERLFEVLRQLRAQGMGMVYVSHRLDEIMAISDRCAVMRDGRLVACCETAQTRQEQLIHWIVGKPLEALRPRTETPETSLTHTAPAAHTPATAPLLELDGVASGNAGPVSFTVQRGEILGLVGLRGAGQEALSRALFGREPLSAGQVRLDGQPMHHTGPQDAIRAGVAYVAADRLEENLAASMSVLENLFPHPALHGDGGFRWQRRRQESRTAQQLIGRFDINPPAAEALVQQLSGGNQQKVVLARWLHLDKPLVILEEPTAGVDIGAKRQIYRILFDAAQGGTAILVVSTDFEEIATLCTRVLVFREGLIHAECRGDDITVGNLLALAAGQAPGVSGATASGPAHSAVPISRPELPA